MLWLTSKPIPATFYLDSQVTIPDLSSNRVGSIRFGSIDITTHECLVVTRMEGWTHHVYAQDGREIFVGDAESVRLGLAGGGTFLRIYPNDEFTCMTYEQFCAEQEAAREAALEEMLYY